MIRTLLLIFYDPIITHWDISINIGTISQKMLFLFHDRLRSLVSLSTDQLFLNPFKMIDHTFPRLMRTSNQCSSQ